MATSVVTEKSDTGRWSEDGPSAPLIIPIVFFVVVGTALILILIKYFKKILDRKRKSETYEIVELMSEEREKIETPIKPGAVPTLNFIRFTGVTVDRLEDNHISRSSVDADESDVVDDVISSNGGISLQVEANVHDSSNEANESPIEGDEESDELLTNSETNLARTRPKSTAPLAATESDV